MTQGSPGRHADADAEGRGTLGVKRGLLPARRPNLILRESLGGKPALMPSRRRGLSIITRPAAISIRSRGRSARETHCDWPLPRAARHGEPFATASRVFGSVT